MSFLCKFSTRSDVQRSEKLHLGLYRPQPARQMLMFITVQCMALSKGLKWKPRLSKRNMTAQICKDRTEKKKTSGTMVFSVQRTEWRCLAIKHYLSKTKHSTSAQTAHTNFQARWGTLDDLGPAATELTMKSSAHSHSGGITSWWFVTSGSVPEERGRRPSAFLR